ncbi:MAG: hypothetical protein ACI9K2_007414, partial [Myxococcota bacterium]
MRLAPLVAVVSLTACAPLSEGMPEEVKRRTPIGMLNIDVYEGEPSNTFSLTIGVNDYSDYDRSLGQEVGTSDLSGAVNDALLWWRVSNTIGVPIPRIRVLTTPSMLDAPWQIGQGASGSSMGGASHDEILAGIGWLTTSLAKDPTAGGLLTFSGHGLHLDGNLALAPADLSGKDLDNAIPYATIAKMLEEAGVAAQVTVVLDTCQAADPTAVAGRTGRALAGPEAPAGAATALPRSRERILTAADLGAPSFEAYLGGQAHGAFTWSMVMLTERWELSREENRSLATVSYGELTRRTGLLLDVLGLDQTPRLYGQDGVEGLPFLSIG